MSTVQLFTYGMHLADNALILAQRNAEWTGHGPVLEQDIAITNIALDLLGQARNFYQYAAYLYNGFSEEEKAEVDHLISQQWKGYGRELAEDDLAFLRDEQQYLNLLLTELPKGDWAETVLRQLLFSAAQYYQYAALKKFDDARLAAIAEKGLKETTYHLRWSSEWVIRLGDGTAESRQRMNRAITELWPYTGELFLPAPFETAVGMDVDLLKSSWRQKIAAVFSEATLEWPEELGMQQGGKTGRHTEHLAPLLAEMQQLQRMHPNAVW